MFGKNASRLLMATAVMAALSATAAAQTKIAIISLQRAVGDTAEIKKAQADLDAKYKPRAAEAEKLTKELESIQLQLQQGQNKLSMQAQQELQLQGQRRQRDLQRLNEDVNAEQERDRNDILGRSTQRMQEIIRKLAEEKGVDIVMEATDTYFFKPALELTKEATAAYDKAYPLK